MSLMHQALDRPAATSQSRHSGYNPLQRGRQGARGRWWLITAAALLLSLALFSWSQWRPSAGDSQAVLAMVPPEQPERVIEPATTEPAAAPRPQARSAAPDTDPDSTAGQANQVAPTETPVTPVLTTLPAQRRQTGDTPANNRASNTANNGAVASPAPEAAPMPSAPDSAGVPAPAPETRAEAAPVSADTPKADAPAPDVVTGRADAARTATGSVETAEPQHALVRQNIQAAIARGDLARARRLLQGWIDREPGLEEPRIWLAKLLLNQNNIDEAEALLTGLRSNEALGLRGLILEQTGRFNDAARVFEALAREQTNTPQWWLHWAINLENSGRLAEARLLYQTYVEQFSGHNARLTAFATERYRALAE